VTEEGLVAILCVSLRLCGTVIGVLYAADRSERRFARYEVNLLRPIGALRNCQGRTS
jgi:GAF domain-containing protein